MNAGANELSTVLLWYQYMGVSKSYDVMAKTVRRILW